jgi:hypothetical protein
MKKLFANKTPQATCSGDVAGGSVVRGKAWGFLFLRGVVNQRRAKRQAAPVALPKYHQDSLNHDT